MEDEKSETKGSTAPCTLCDCPDYSPEHTGGHCYNTDSKGNKCNHRGTEHDL